MECLKLCVAFGLASVARGSAAVGPLSYLLQYKRSVLSNPTGLAAFNGFGGAPFGFAAYGQPGFAAYNQPGFAAYNQPGFAAYGQPGFGAYGLDGSRTQPARALAPAPEFQYGAQSGYGFDAAPAAGYPFAVHYGLTPAAPQLLYAPNAQQPTAAAPKAPDAAPRPARVTIGPTVAAESTAARFQSASSQQPVPSPAPAAVPDLFLELTPPHYSEPSIDYSKSAGGGGGHPVDFGPASPSGSDANRGYVPFPGGVRAASPSDAYLVPSISYALPTNTYSHTEPNAVNSPDVPGKTAPKSYAADAPNDRFASSAMYGEPGPGGPVPGSFTDAYYGAPADVPSAARGSSNPTSANTYGDSNSIQSSSRGNDKPIHPGNVRGDPTSSADKRGTSDLGRPDKSSPMSYFGGDYKNVQRDDTY